MATNEGGGVDGTLSSMVPEDITSEKANIQFLILRQMDRTNWLMSVSRSSKTSREATISLLRGIRSSIQALELMMTPFFSPKVLKQTAAIKKKLDQNYKFRAQDGKIRFNRLLYTSKFISSNRITSVRHTVNYDTDIYMAILDEWYLVIMQNLASTNLAPVKKKRYDFDD